MTETTRKMHSTKYAFIFYAENIFQYLIQLKIIAMNIMSVCVE